MGYYKKRNKGKGQQDNYLPPFEQSILGQNIEILNLRQNTFDLLKGAGVNVLQDLLKRRPKDLYKIKMFNKKNLFDVQQALDKRNLFLRPEETEETPKAQPDTQKEEKQNPSKKDKKGFVDVKFLDVSEAKTKREREKHRPPKTVIPDVKDKYVKINKNGLWGFQERATGKEIIKASYSDVFTFKEDLCCVELEDKYGYIDRRGRFIIEPKYDMASSFSEGYACVYQGDKCGYIDKEDNIIVPFEFDAGTPVTDSGCRVKKNGQWGELNIVDGKPSEIRWII